MEIGIPDGEWEVLSDEKNSFLWKDAVCAGKQILAEEKSVTVLGSRKVILPESVSGDSAEKRCENRGRESAEKICESGKEGDWRYEMGLRKTGLEDIRERAGELLSDD